MPVFGQIGQVAEIGEGTRYADCPVTAQPLEQFLERLVGFMVGVTAKRYGELADLLDKLERGDAFLLTDDVAQNATQKTNVVHQRAFVVLGALRRIGCWRLVHGAYKKGLRETTILAMLASPVDSRIQRSHKIEPQPMSNLRIATRESRLALWQAEHVQAHLMQHGHQ